MEKTFPAWFRRNVAEDPKREIFIFYDDKLTRTSIVTQELFTLAARFAHILHKNGLKRGQVVACSVPISLELVVCNFGIMLAGGVFLDTEVTAENSEAFKDHVNLSQAKVLVVRREEEDLTWKKIKDSVGGEKQSPISFSLRDSSLPSVETVVFVTRKGFTDVSKGFLDLLRDYTDEYIDDDVPESAIITLTTTSGTTGKQKLVMRTARSFIEDSKQCSCVPGLSDKKVFAMCPWSWIAGNLVDVFDGCTRVQPDLWSIQTNVMSVCGSILRKERVAGGFLTPFEIMGIMQHGDFKDRKLFETLLVAGYPVTKQIIQKLLMAADRLSIRYSQSEAVSISYKIITRVEEFEDFNCGQPCPGTEIKFVDENMQELPPGKPGKLMIRPPGLFSGYLGQPEVTKEVITPDGWFINNDAGYIDPNGNLMILGRYDHVIKHKDKTIFPALIEKPIRDSSLVESVVVLAVPDETNYHNICACVVKKEGCEITEADVINMIKNGHRNDTNGIVLPHHVLFLDSIEVNKRGKLNIREIAGNAVKLIKGKN